MIQIKLVLLSLLVALISACGGVIPEKQTERFFADGGDTTITLFPTYIKNMATDHKGKPLTSIARAYSPGGKKAPEAKRPTSLSDSEKSSKD